MNTPVRPALLSLAVGLIISGFNSARAETGTQTALTPKVVQIATITGTLPILEELRRVQGELNGAGSSGESRAHSLTRLMYLRDKLTVYMQTASLEVNAVKAAVELAIAKIDDARAQIVEKRARALKRNSMINFVSGGVTKMVGYSMAMGGAEFPSNVLEVLDGGIQSSLSGLTIREQEEEKHYNQSVPQLLITVIDDSNEQTHEFPRAVWQYLESQSFSGEEIITETTQQLGGDTTGGESRRGKLIAAWSSSGMIGRHHAPRRPGVKPPMARIGQGKTLTAQLLEDRAAMLSDLKSVVAQMNNSLMQLSQVIKSTYVSDPPI